MTRQYDFSTGIETSSAPTQSDPSTSGDLVSKGYGDKTYAAREYFGHAVADYTALTALSTSGDNKRSDGQFRLVMDTGETWYFDAGSSDTEDGSTILQPDSGSGRWKIVSGGGGSSGGSAGNLELLEKKGDEERFGIVTSELDNSAFISGSRKPIDADITGALIEDYAVSGTSMKVVWAPTVLNDSDQNYDATGNWTATGQAASLSTSSSDVKVGSDKLTFNKGGSGTEAAIRYDRSSQDLSISSKYRVWFWVYLPSITNLSNVLLRIYADSTSNYRTWTTATDYNGDSLSTGWNLCFVDVSTGGSASGSGWTYDELARYVEVGVTTSSSGQTYTGIAFGGLWFSLGAVNKWGPLGLEFSVFDTSNKKDVTFDVDSSYKDGPIDIAVSGDTGFTAGISNSDRAYIQRSSMEFNSAGYVAFDDDFSSGAIATDQELRITKYLRESFSGNLGAYIHSYSPLTFEISNVSGNDVDCLDAAEMSGDLVSGDTVYVFKGTFSAGKADYTLLGERTLTANSTYSSPTLTLSLSDASDVSEGDILVKKDISAEYSHSATGSNESFSSLSLSTSPNGAQLLDGGLSYPNASNVYAHWLLGAITDERATKDIFNLSSSSRDLTKLGTPNLQNPFVSGRYSYGNAATTPSALRTGSNTAQFYDGNGEEVYISLWVYSSGNPSAIQQICSAYRYASTNNYGWILDGRTDSTLRVSIYNGGPSTSGSIATSAISAGWNHILLKVYSGAFEIWINGVSGGSSAGAVSAAGTTAMYLGIIANTFDASFSQPLNEWRIADFIVWRGGNMTAEDAKYLYGLGFPKPVGHFPILRSEYSVTGSSGRRLSMKAKPTRETSNVSPIVFDMGIIKT